MSPHQFDDPSFLDRVDEVLAETGFPGSSLEFELTEGVFLGSVAPTGDLLTGLHERRIRLSIDDFGTGYSSLSYLRRLPISTLKIDRVFVQDMVRARSSAEIVTAIIAMARGLGVDVIAEGIETDEQLSSLRELGCPFGQGFLISRPMSSEGLADWWESPTALAAASA